MNVIKYGLNLLNILTTNYLKDENNFLIFEETVFPNLPGRTVNRKSFSNFRNVLAQRVSKAPPVNPIAQLESLNSSVIGQNQTQQLEKLQTNYFTLRRKRDDLNRTVGNLQLDVDLKFDNLSDNLDDKLNNINNKLDRVLTILNTLKDLEENIKTFLNTKFKNLYEKIDASFDNSYLQITESLDNLNTNLEIFIKGNLDEILNTIKNLFNDFFNKINNIFKGLLKKINKELENTRLNLRTYIFDELGEQTINLNDSFLVVLTGELKTQSISIISSLTARLLIGVGDIQANMNFNRLYTNSKIDVFKKSMDNFFMIKSNVIITNVFNTWYDNKKDKLFKLLSNYICERIDKLFKLLSNYICERIVGEGYIKYDANYTYMPTILLRYKTKSKLDEL